MERLTANRRRIMLALYAVAPEMLYGLEISRQAKISSGALYPALRELRMAGLIDADWRPPDHDPDGQPLRYYRLSSNGFALAQGMVDGEVQGTNWRRFLPSPRLAR